MKPVRDIETATLESLVQRYVEAAAAHGRATETGDYVTGNQAYEQVVTVYRELRRRGGDALCALLPLLSSADVGVRSWAGGHALEFAPGDAEPVLAAISELPGSLVGFSAKMTLRQWREGKLRFP